MAQLVVSVCTHVCVHVCVWSDTIRRKRQTPSRIHQRALRLHWDKWKAAGWPVILFVHEERCFLDWLLLVSHQSRAVERSSPSDSWERYLFCFIYANSSAELRQMIPWWSLHNFYRSSRLRAQFIFQLQENYNNRFWSLCLKKKHLTEDI